MEFLKKIFANQLGGAPAPRIFFGKVRGDSEATSFAVLTAKDPRALCSIGKFSGLATLRSAEALDSFAGRIDATRSESRFESTRSPSQLASAILGSLARRYPSSAQSATRVGLAELAIEDCADCRATLAGLAVLAFEVPEIFPLCFEKLLDALVSLDAGFVRKSRGNATLDFCMRLVIVVIQALQDPNTFGTYHVGLIGANIEEIKENPHKELYEVPNHLSGNTPMKSHFGTTHREAYNSPHMSPRKTPQMSPNNIASPFRPSPPCDFSSLLSQVYYSASKLPLPLTLRSAALIFVFDHFFDKVTKLHRPNCAQYAAFYLASRGQNSSAPPGFDSFSQYFLHRSLADFYRKDLHPSAKIRLLCFLYSFLRGLDGRAELIPPVASRLISYLAAVARKLGLRRRSLDRPAFKALIEASVFPALVFYLARIFEENVHVLQIEKAAQLRGQIDRFASECREIIEEIIECFVPAKMMFAQLAEASGASELAKTVENSSVARDLSTSLPPSSESVFSLLSSSRSEIPLPDFLPFERCSLDFHALYFAKKSLANERESALMSCSISSFETEQAAPSRTRALRKTLPKF